MDDLYPSFWSYLFWGVAALFVLAGLWPSSPAIQDGPKRGETLLGCLMVAALMVGLGFWAFGSRSEDSLRQANIAVARSERELASLDAAERAVSSGETAATSTSRNMSFDACLATIDVAARQFGTPINVVDSSDVRIVRIPTSDGSVLITCSRPDQKMITTRSSQRY